MLVLLHIEQIAVIETADVSFQEGLNVLTGETGAGKSIVVDAIHMVTGQRISRELIRTGAKRALVTAVFSHVPPLPALAEAGVAPDEEGNLIFSRELQEGGRSLCRIGGRPVPLSVLRALGGQLLNVHGQQDGQQLLNEATHLQYLDRFANTAPELAAYQMQYQALAKLGKELGSIQMDEAEKSRRIDTLTYQINELEQADLKPGEWDALEERRGLLRSAGRLMDALEQANLLLSGDEDSEGACSLLEEAGDALRPLETVSEGIQALSQRLTDAIYTVRDIGEDVRNLRYEFDFSPQALDEVESRLDRLHRLGRKYGASTEEMLGFLEESRGELARIQRSEETIRRLEQQLEQAKEEAQRLAGMLSQKRKQAARLLEERITAQLRQLDMKQVRLAVEVSPKRTAGGLDDTGMDEVRFLLSANAGEELRPIHKIASGGELARVMLAMKSELAEDIGTLVFDEVDTGVSGRAASRVAEKLQSVAEGRQVLCVTHLPQIAAAGACHLLVEKQERDGRTFTAVRPLTQGERAEEIARIISGDQITKATVENAREMLAHWSGIRNKRQRGSRPTESEVPSDGGSNPEESNQKENRRDDGI